MLSLLTRRGQVTHIWVHWVSHYWFNNGMLPARWILFVLPSFLCKMYANTYVPNNVITRIRDISFQILTCLVHIRGIRRPETSVTNPPMYISHIPQCTMQNRNVSISGLNGALWYMGQVHCGIFRLVYQHSVTMARPAWVDPGLQHLTWQGSVHIPDTRRVFHGYDRSSSIQVNSLYSRANDVSSSIVYGFPWLKQSN